MTAAIKDKPSTSVAMRTNASEWEPVEPKKTKADKPPRTRNYLVSIVGGKKPEQVIEKCYDSSEAVARYVKQNKLVSHAHTFRSVEVKKRV